MAHPGLKLEQAEAVVRSARAREEWQAYGYEEIGYLDGQRVWALTSPTGARYETSGAGCTCPDYRTRCSRLGIPCKHQHMIRLRREWRLAPARKALGECATDYVITPPAASAAPTVTVTEGELPAWFRSLLA